MIGAKALTPTVLDEIDKALLFHELIKIKIQSQDREFRHTLTNEICDALSAELIQSMGQTVTLYRINPDKAL